MVEKDAFLMEPKHQFICTNEENEFMVPNHYKKGDYYLNPSLSNWKINIKSKMVKREVFLMKPKHQYHLSWWGECIYGA